MLMLKRRVGQRVLIGSDIVITVNAVEGNSATLGIQCPRHIAVDREEIRQLKEPAPDPVKTELQNAQNSDNSVILSNPVSGGEG